MSRGATITDTRTTPPKTASASGQAENSSKSVSNSLRNTGRARRLCQKVKVLARPSDQSKQNSTADERPPPGLEVSVALCDGIFPVGQRAARSLSERWPADSLADSCVRLVA